MVGQDWLLTECHMGKDMVISMSTDSQNTDEKKNSSYIRETIVNKPARKGRMWKKIVGAILLAIIFGAVAGVTFAVVQHFLPGLEQESYPTFSRDDESSEPIESSSEEVESTAAPQTQPEESSSAPEESSAQEPPATTQPSLTRKEILELVSNAAAQAVEQAVLVEKDIKQIDKLRMAQIAKVEDALVVVQMVQNETTSAGLFDQSIKASNETFGVILDVQSPALNSNIYILAHASSFVDLRGSIRVVIGENTVPAILKRIDWLTGIALITVDAQLIAPEARPEGLPLGNSRSIKTGDYIIMGGEPQGFANSVVTGLVSGTRNDKVVIDGRRRIILTDVQGYTGNKGVMVDTAGSIVGWVVTQKVDEDEGILSAVGISDLKYIIEDLIGGKPTAYLGIEAHTVTEELQNEQGMPAGLFISKIQGESPAMIAGLQEADIVTAIDDVPLQSAKELQRFLDLANSGQTITIQIQRPTGETGYGEMTFSIELGERQ